MSTRPSGRTCARGPVPTIAIADDATGFWGEPTSGWHYDLMLAVMDLTTVTMGGGRFVLG